MTTITRTCAVCGRDLPISAFNGGLCRVCLATAHVRPGGNSQPARLRMAESFRRLRVRELLAQRAA